MKSNPNIFLKGHMWYDASTQEGGLPVEYMKKYCNMSFQETMSYLLGKPMEMEKLQGIQVKPFPEVSVPQQKAMETSENLARENQQNVPKQGDFNNAPKEHFSNGNLTQGKFQANGYERNVAYESQRQDYNAYPKQDSQGNQGLQLSQQQQNNSTYGSNSWNQGQNYEKPPFKLPDRNDKMSRTFAYLTKGRKLDYDVISHFAKAKTLYESCEVFDPQKKPIHNAVFVGTDEKGVPRHAHKHGLSSFGDSFKQNIVSSDSAFSFHHVGSNDRLFVFEAPIDMMSFISLYKQDWQESSYVALCGVGSTAIQWMSSQFPQIQRLCLCLDNDKAGMEATNSIINEFEEKGFATHFLLPQAKDWNEDLVILREQEQNQNFNQGAMAQGGYAMGMQ